MVDCVEQAGIDSFPASDPPSFTPMGGSATPPPLRAPAWLLNVDQSRLPMSGTLHLLLLNALEDISAATNIETGPPPRLTGELEAIAAALRGHREVILGPENLREDIETSTQWLLSRFERLVAHHEQLEEVIDGILAKLEAWPPSGSEPLSWQIVAGELRIAEALLTQVLMEEHFLEHAMFDSPPAHD